MRSIAISGVSFDGSLLQSTIEPEHDEGQEATLRSKDESG